MNAWFVVWVSVIGFGLLVGLVFFAIALVLERRDKRRRREAIRRVQRFKDDRRPRLVCDQERKP